MTFFGLSLPPEKAVAAPHTKGTILFVDDDPIIREMVGGRLTMEQYAVFPVPSAEKALETLERVTPDLIILDIAMPGLGGLGFLKRLMEAIPHTTCPVIIFSGRHEMESFFKDMPVATFMPKTTHPEVFIQKVHEVIHNAHATRSKATPDAPRKLMLIENDQAVTRHLIHYLSKWGGFSVQGHDGARGFLDEVTRLLPDVLLIKYFLPSHNGTTLAQALSSHPPTRDIPVILYDDSGMQLVAPVFQNIKLLVPSGRDHVLLHAVRQIAGGT